MAQSAYREFTLGGSIVFRSHSGDVPCLCCHDTGIGQAIVFPREDASDVCLCLPCFGALIEALRESDLDWEHLVPGGLGMEV